MFLGGSPPPIFVPAVIISSVAFGDKIYTRLLKENYDFTTKVSLCQFARVDEINF